MIPDWLPYLLNGILLLAIASIIYYGIRLGITPMPSSRKAVATFIDLIPDATSGKIVDLGAGWGTLAYPIAKKFPDADVVGCELSPIPWLYSRLKGVFVRRPNLTLHRQSVFDIDLSTWTWWSCTSIPPQCESSARNSSESCAPERSSSPTHSPFRGGSPLKPSTWASHGCPPPTTSTSTTFDDCDVA